MIGVRHGAGSICVLPVILSIATAPVYRLHQPDSNCAGLCVRNCCDDCRGVAVYHQKLFQSGAIRLIPAGVTVPNGTVISADTLNCAGSIVPQWYHWLGMFQTPPFSQAWIAILSATLGILTGAYHLTRTYTTEDSSLWAIPSSSAFVAAPAGHVAPKGSSVLPLNAFTNKDSEETPGHEATGPLSYEESPPVKLELEEAAVHDADLPQEENGKEELCDPDVQHHPATPGMTSHFLCRLHFSSFRN